MILIPNIYSFVNNCHRNLASMLYSSQIQLMGKSSLIHLLFQPWSQRFMNLECRRNHRFSQLILWNIP